jgi:large subunit ribosomal protein L4
MPSVDVLNKEGEKVSTIDLSDKVFGTEINEHLLHMAVVHQLADKRQGTQKAKTRSEVSGGGRKPWRQKGTGHARQGSTRAPQWTGGGMVFAPVPRDYSFKMNRKERQKALFSALTDKVNNEKLVVVDELSFDAPKTKDMVKVLSNLKAEKALVVLTDKDGNENVALSARNIPTVRLTYSNSLSTYDILKYDKVVFTQDAIKKVEEVYA